MGGYAVKRRRKNSRRLPREQRETEKGECTGNSTVHWHAMSQATVQAYNYEGRLTLATAFTREKRIHALLYYYIYHDQ